MSKTGIIDYGSGNLHSVVNALNYIGADCFISGDTRELEKADLLILPGVGAFPDAAELICRGGMKDFVLSEAKKKPILGICLGMQLLFSRGWEFRECEGLGLIDGDVIRLRAGESDKRYKIPHIGWNGVRTVNENPLTKGIDDGSCFYFVHSYMGMCRNPAQLYAVTEYGEDVTAIVGEGYVFGTQFHPEKSGEAGLRLLRNFVALA
ncbi:MAG: imidazole glycerol phosphate synthase subunit HisH [Clostridia bacterium]|nr:imidazole glycerol phosphate synthase subunit HisH [Clostridia bacterium]